MGLVPSRSMQISSTLFRHERRDATNRNQREAALARLIQEKKRKPEAENMASGFTGLENILNLIKNL